MKQLSALLALFLLVACASATPVPTPSAEPTPTPIPLSGLDLEEILLLSGDLPPSYEGGQIRYEAPRKFGDLLPADNVIVQDIYTDIFKAEPGVVILLYEAIPDVEETFESLCEVNDLSPQVDPITGEMAATHLKLSLGANSATVVFVRCHAVVYVNLFGGGVNLDLVGAYAERLDRRLIPLVCR